MQQNLCPIGIATSGTFLGVSFLRKPMGYVGDHGALCADVAARESGEKRALMSLASLQTTLGHRPLFDEFEID